MREKLHACSLVEFIRGFLPILKPSPSSFSLSTMGCTNLLIHPISGASREKSQSGSTSVWLMLMALEEHVSVTGSTPQFVQRVLLKAAGFLLVVLKIKLIQQPTSSRIIIRLFLHSEVQSPVTEVSHTVSMLSTSYVQVVATLHNRPLLLRLQPFSKEVAIGWMPQRSATSASACPKPFVHNCSRNIDSHLRARSVTIGSVCAAEMLRRLEQRTTASSFISAANLALYLQL